MSYTTQTTYTTKLAAMDAKYEAMVKRVDEQIAELQAAFDRLDNIVERNKFIGERKVLNQFLGEDE